MTAPVLELALRDPTLAENARRRLQELLGERATVVCDGAGERVRLVSVEDLPSTEPARPIVAVADLALPELVSLLRERPFVDHVVSPRLLTDDASGYVAGALAKLLAADPALPVRPFSAPSAPPSHSLSIADSDQREQPLEAICESARQAGGSPLAVERIRDVAEEAITNSLYNAPGEERRHHTIRSERVQLQPERATQVSFGVAGKLFFVRVRDGFGSFRRARMCEVLERCRKQEAIALDTSRGGAGLGLWRMFNAATVITIHVQPELATEINVGIDLTRRSPGAARAVHLFFDGGAS